MPDFYSYFYYINLKLRQIIHDIYNNVVTDLVSRLYQSSLRLLGPTHYGDSFGYNPKLRNDTSIGVQYRCLVPELKCSNTARIYGSLFKLGWAVASYPRCIAERTIGRVQCGQTYGASTTANIMPDHITGVLKL